MANCGQDMMAPTDLVMTYTLCNGHGRQASKGEILGLGQSLIGISVGKIVDLR